MKKEQSMEQVEKELRTHAANFAYPPTPDIASTVRAHLAAGGNGAIARSSPRRGALVSRTRVGRRRWAGIALVLALISTALLAVPEVRAALQALLRIGSIEIVVGTPTPGVLPTPVSGWEPKLVGETSLADAQAQVSFSIKVPTYPGDLGSPDRVFKQNVRGDAVILGWTDPEQPDKARLVLHQLTSEIMGTKIVDENTVPQASTVHGQEAVWVSSSHMVEFYSDAGPEMGPQRLVEGNVLIWVEGGITYRLEARLTLEEAVRIAESLVSLPDGPIPFPTLTSP